MGPWAWEEVSVTPMRKVDPPYMKPVESGEAMRGRDGEEAKKNSR